MSKLIGLVAITLGLGIIACASDRGTDEQPEATVRGGSASATYFSGAISIDRTEPIPTATVGGPVPIPYPNTSPVGTTIKPTTGGSSCGDAPKDSDAGTK